MKIQFFRSVLFIALCAATAASANWRRQSGFFCMPQANNTAWAASPDLGMMTRANSTSIAFRCPIFDDSHIDRNLVAPSALNVHVANNSAATWTHGLQACAQFAAVDGIACTGGATPATVSANSVATLTVGQSAWIGSSTYIYVDILVAQNCGVVGYFYAK
jgi:hypothetical protein